MEADTLSPMGLGLLLLPFLVTLLAALCVRCRELPGKWGSCGVLNAGYPIGSSPQPLAPSDCSYLSPAWGVGWD